MTHLTSSCVKVKGQKPPVPSRGLKAGGADGGEAAEDEEAEEEASADLIPRNDIRWARCRSLRFSSSDTPLV